MARDQKARDADEEASLLDRRKYLKLAGASIIATGATGASSSTVAAADYETITVPAGETFTEQSPEFDLQDGGTWENKLIDVTADGAGIYIDIDHLSNWTIRNVGVEGVNDSGEEVFRIAERDSGGQIRLENVYIGDGMGYSGSGDGGGANNGGAGVFVHPDHAGDLVIDRINVQHFANNGVYASAPGKDSTFDGTPGSRGNVVIKNSFGANNDVSCFRLGQGADESRFENCVAVSSDSARGFWAENGDVYAVNCDSADNKQLYCVGSGDSQATMHLTDCRSGNTDTVATWDVCTSGTFDGAFGSTPRTSPPKGVPLSAEEAAGGTSGSGGGGGTSPAGTVLELVAGSDASNVSYEFTVEGEVSKHTVSDTIAAGGNDTITDNGDGTVTVSGTSGNGYGDAYLVDGTFSSMDLDESQWTIRYDGSEVSVAELTGSVLELVAADGTSDLTYEFTVDGSVAKRTWADDNAANDNDTITDNGDGTVTVSGASGNGYGDSFLIAGEFVSMSLDESQWTVRYDGSEVTVAELTGTVLELVAGSDASNVSYEFTVDGDVAKRTDAGDNAADDNDAITDNGDGTVTVTGTSGNGYGDSFLVDGEFASMDLDESQWTIRYDGSEVSVAELTGGLPKTIVIDGGPTRNQKSSYRFTVSGDVEKNADRGSIQSSDAISGSEASGQVWGGKDAFDFSGEITDLTIDGPVTVSVEGASSPADGDPLSKAVVIDGGEYPRHLTRYTVTVSGEAQKSSSLGSIQSNDTVSGGEMSGKVWGGKDGYNFSGEITAITLDGPGTLRAEDGQ